MIENENNFHLPDVFGALQKRWKPLAYFVFACLLLCSITLFFLPKYYKSTAVVLAANPLLSDKAHLFNSNIDQLYSNFGTGDDLDRLYGIASLDTTYKILVDKFDLVNYYSLKSNNPALNHRNAVLLLRDDLTLQKTELNQLKVIAFSKNAVMAASLANSMVEAVQLMTQQTWRETYQLTLEGLNSSIAGMENEMEHLSNKVKVDSVPVDQVDDNYSAFYRRRNLAKQIEEFQTAALQVSLAIKQSAPALIVVENAYPSAKADKPNKLLILLSTFFISLFFGALAVLLYHRKQSVNG